MRRKRKLNAAKSPLPSSLLPSLPYMAEQHISPYKRRRRLDQGQLPRNGPQPKTGELCHPTQPPPAFWDNLSEIPLTRNALRELNRRNDESIRSARSLPRKRTCRPVTRPDVLGAYQTLCETRRPRPFGLERCKRGLLVRLTDRLTICSGTNPR